MDFSSLAAQLNAGTILPELIVTSTLLLVVVGDLIVGRTASARWTPYLSIGGLLAAVAALYYQWDATNPVAFWAALMMMPSAWFSGA